MNRKSKAAEFIGESYNVVVTGRNVQVTESMKDYVLEKISKLEKYGDRIIDVVVTMDIQRVEHRVDIAMKFNNVKIKSQACTTDMYASIDMAVHKMETQLLKYKDRLQEHHSKNLATIDMNVNVIASTDRDEINDEIESENARHLSKGFSTARILSQEKRTLRILNLEEAIMKIELSGDRFLVFRSEEDRRLKVIYRREDNNYGVIEVEA